MCRTRIGQPNHLTPNQQQIHFVEVKYCEDTRTENQLEAAKQQHREFCQLLHGHRATAAINHHIILLGVGGIIYRPHTLEPLQKLGLEPCKAVKLALKLYAHFIKYAYKPVST